VALAPQRRDKGASRRGAGHPAGRTDAIQPLDQKILGELKARTRAKAIAEGIMQGKTQVKATDAVRHLLTAWGEIDPWIIASAWQATLT
jgi:hypothetical protein